MPRLGLRDTAGVAAFDGAAPVHRPAEPAGRTDSPPRTAGSVVIPAHDEANVIGRGLNRLFGTLRTAVEVVVVCNGCSDDTAGVARRTGHPLTVIEVGAASKARALRAADEVATALPRAYVDADVLVSGRAIEALFQHLSRPGALAARPPIIFDTSSSPWIVRRFYRARSEIPAVMGSLWGAGMYALSAEGRSRFDGFPLVVADDLFVDRLFRADEIEVVDTDPVVVVAPGTTVGLLASFRRTFRGNRALSGVAPAGGRPGTSATVQDLLRLARRGRPELVDALVYAAVVVVARALAWRYPASSDHWERDGTRR
jgi:glycosyltransferase involved in cell wall biosynthesis